MCTFRGIGVLNNIVQTKTEWTSSLPIGSSVLHIVASLDFAGRRFILLWIKWPKVRVFTYNLCFVQRRSSISMYLTDCIRNWTHTNSVKLTHWEPSFTELDFVWFIWSNVCRLAYGSYAPECWPNLVIQGKLWYINEHGRRPRQRQESQVLFHSAKNAWLVGLNDDRTELNLEWVAFFLSFYHVCWLQICISKKS